VFRQDAGRRRAIQEIKGKGQKAMADAKEAINKTAAAANNNL